MPVSAVTAARLTDCPELANGKAVTHTPSSGRPPGDRTAPVTVPKPSRCLALATRCANLADVGLACPAPSTWPAAKADAGEIAVTAVSAAAIAMGRRRRVQVVTCRA